MSEQQNEQSHETAEPSGGETSEGHDIAHDLGRVAITGANQDED